MDDIDESDEIGSEEEMTGDDFGASDSENDKSEDSDSQKDNDDDDLLPIEKAAKKLNKKKEKQK